MNDQKIRLFGTTWCSDCKRAKKFFGEHRVSYEFIDVDDNPEGIRVVEEVNRGKRIIPTILFPDGTVLVEPSNVELADKLQLQTKPECEFYDLVVVGGGPAALTAALYAAREGIETLVVERSGLGGQAGITERLDNYPGFPEGIGGGEFADRVVEQCRRFGVELLSATEVMAIGSDSLGCSVQLGGGEEVRAHAILLAPGSTYRRLDVPGEEDLIGAGVHFCATCDGPFYRGQDVLVIGGGNSAVEEAIFLTRFASQVTIVHRSAQLSATKVAQEKAFATPTISVELETVVDEFHGNGHLSSVILRNLRTGERREVQKSGAFVFIGLRPNTEFLRDVVKLDERGFIVTGPMLDTNLEGVFAAGDARAGSTKQLVSAAGEGATAALMVRQYLERKKALSPHRED